MKTPCVSRSVTSDSANPWTVAYQAPLSMGFFRQEDQSGLPFPSPGEDPVQPINKINKKRETMELEVKAAVKFGKEKWNCNVERGK